MPPTRRIEIRVNIPVHNNQNNNTFLNPYTVMRQNLYRYAFWRFSIVYAKLVPEFTRKLMEFFLLVLAFFCFITLVYVHVVFVQTPSTCLEIYKDQWDKNGILRIEILRNMKENYTIEDSYWKERTLRMQHREGHPFYSPPHNEEQSAESEENDTPSETEEQGDLDDFDADMLEYANSSVVDPFWKFLPAEENKIVKFQEELVYSGEFEEVYLMEFSPEYGYLRLKHSKRKELNIPVTLVTLDPDSDDCFGSFLDRFLLNNFLGYDNLVLDSIKNMAQKKELKGYVRNIGVEVEYAFVQSYPNEKSYAVALFVMTIFTITISMLLRHSNNQIFIAVANVFSVVLPWTMIYSTGAPVLTVLLALVGMEAIMSEFFNDRSLAVYIILIVWMADMYVAVCCQSPMSKRHWFRFFFLYHYVFYAYNYKFGGAYWPLSLTTSWLFIVHSMVWFYHHYELPRILQRQAAQMVHHDFQNNNNPSPGNEPPPGSGNGSPGDHQPGSGHENPGDQSGSGHENPETNQSADSSSGNNASDSSSPGEQHETSESLDQSEASESVGSPPTTENGTSEGSTMQAFIDDSRPLECGAPKSYKMCYDPLRKYREGINCCGLELFEAFDGPFHESSLASSFRKLGSSRIQFSEHQSLNVEEKSLASHNNEIFDQFCKLIQMPGISSKVSRGSVSHHSDVSCVLMKCCRVCFYSKQIFEIEMMKVQAQKCLLVKTDICDKCLVKAVVILYDVLLWLSLQNVQNIADCYSEFVERQCNRNHLLSVI